MDRRWLKYFMPAAVGFVEDEKGTFPAAHFAQKGNSGLSFGRMQNDILTNPDAEKTLRQILEKENVPEIDSIVRAGKILNVGPGDFERNVPGMTARVNAALTRNPDIVNDLDIRTTDGTRSEVSNALGGAARNPNGPGELGVNPNPRFLAKLAGWANRSGNLDATTEFLRTTPQVTEAAFDDYLRRQKYFRQGPETVEQWTGRLDRAVPVGLEAYNNAPPPPEPEVKLWNEETDATGPMPENLFNMPQSERIKWGIP